MANYIKSFNFRNGVQVDNDNFIVNAAGRVGIGTTVPDKILDVRGNAKVVGHITATDASVSGIVTVGSITINGSTGTISATSFSGSAGNFGDQAVVAITTDGFVASATGLTTTSRIGIGTTNPLAFLHLETPAETEGWQVRTNSEGLSNESGFFRDENDNYECVLRNGAGGLGFIKNNGGSSDPNLHFHVGTTEKMRITSDGDVGIGTNNPGTKLDVRGSLNVTGISTFGDNITVNGNIVANGNINGDTGTNISGMNNVTANKFTGTDLIGQQLNVSGVSTFSDNIFIGTGATVGFGTTVYFKNNAKAIFGDSNDLQIYHDGANSFISDEGTGDLVIQGTHLRLRSATPDQETYILCTSNSSIELYHNNLKKLETTNEGILVSGGTTTGALSVSGVSTFSDNILIGTGATVGFGSTAYFKDDVGAFFGDDNDLRIYHDSINEHSYIADKGTGNLVLQSDNKIEMITFNPPLGGGAEKMFEAVKNGAVTLYFDGNKRIETSNTGVTVTGSIGIGTSAPSADLQIRKASGNATLEVISDTNKASISIGNSVGAGTSSASINYGSVVGFGVFSTDQSFNIINRDTGNFNYFISNDISSDSGFRWHKGSSNTLMTLTGIGSLGIGITNPQHKLSVQGISTFTGNAHFDNNVTIDGTLTADLTGNVTGNVTGNLSGNVNTTTGISTFNDIKVSEVGIGTTSPRCVLDLGESAGDDTGFVLFPSTSTSQRNGIGSTIEGAIIYNNTNKRLELYNGIGWVGIATVV